MSFNNLNCQLPASSLTSIARCAGFTLLLVTNDLVLRDPAVLLQGVGVANIASSVAQTSLDVPFLALLFAVGRRLWEGPHW